jgi:hypothetical protein
LGLLLCSACAGRREQRPAPAVQDYATPGEIVGEVVRREAGEPVGGATVTLVGDDDASLTTRTDPRGWFAFYGVAPGAYVVLAGDRDVDEGVLVHLPPGRGRRVNLAL